MRPELAQPRFQALQIGGHHRLHIGVGAHRAEALELADLRRHLRRNGHRNPRRATQQDVAHLAFVFAVLIAVDQPHGDALVALADDLAGQSLDLVDRHRHQNLALGVDPLGDDETVGARHQGLGKDDVQVVLLEPVLGPHLDDVAEPLGGDQRRPGAAPLDHRIGRQRRAVDDLGNVAHADPGQFDHLRNTVQHRLLRRLRRRQDLVGIDVLAEFQHNVGKRSPDIRPNAGNLRLLIHYGLRM